MTTNAVLRASPERTNKEINEEISRESKSLFHKNGPFKSKLEIYAALKLSLDDFYDSIRNEVDNPKLLLKICSISRNAYIQEIGPPHLDNDKSTPLDTPGLFEDDIRHSQDEHQKADTPEEFPFVLPERFRIGQNEVFVEEIFDDGSGGMVKIKNKSDIDSSSDSKIYCSLCDSLASQLDHQYPRRRTFTLCYEHKKQRDRRYAEINENPR